MKLTTIRYTCGHSKRMKAMADEAAVFERMECPTCWETTKVVWYGLQ